MVGALNPFITIFFQEVIKKKFKKKIKKGEKRTNIEASIFIDDIYYI